MSIRRRLSPEDSKAAALEAARLLLIQQGPQAVTLKAVAAKVHRTHANLLHHFGSAAGLQKELARHIAGTVCHAIAEAVLAMRRGSDTARHVVDMTFDAFDREGAGALASWMRLTGNEDALDPIIDAIHDMVDELDATGTGTMRDVTLTLTLLALGDAQMGGPLARSLDMPRETARLVAERILVEGGLREGRPFTEVAL